MRSKNQSRNRVPVSTAFIEAVRNDPLQQHVLAVKAGITPAYLSNILNKVLMVWPEDTRVLRVAKVVGFTGECFGE